MDEAQKVGIALVLVGLPFFLLGWGLDRSELRGRPVEGKPRALVSSILTWTGGAIMVVGAVLLVP
jgi:hypothetical protein